MLLALRSLALAFWFGGGLATMFATRAIFKTVQDRKQAGDLSGAVLRAAQWGRFGWALPFLASAFAPRGGAFWLGVLSLLFALLQLADDRQVRRLRAEMGGSVAEDDPRRRRFGLLHGVSMLMFLLHTLLAGAALVLASWGSTPFGAVR